MPSPLKPFKKGKKAKEWDKQRTQWFRDNPKEYYNCHYCLGSMDERNTTLDHENNRNHPGRILECCYLCNSRKGSVSHDRYVDKYHKGHVCKH